jgi:hypothetical protein
VQTLLPRDAKEKCDNFTQQFNTLWEHIVKAAYVYRANMDTAPTDQSTAPTDLPTASSNVQLSIAPMLFDWENFYNEVRVYIAKWAMDRFSHYCCQWR